MINATEIDIKENDIVEYSVQLLPILLKDNSTKKNIIWATDNYIQYGMTYRSSLQITIEAITGTRGSVIKPRVSKNREEQSLRVRERAEVFTPSWICNKQNNLVDNAWFDNTDIFNIEKEHSWSTIDRAIQFPTKDGKTWQDYINDVRLEVACGEAPYLVSRYDTITGKYIPVRERIGLLDRKLRIVSENTTSKAEWIEWAKISFQNIYGYEWQGDNLLLARENILYTYIDFYKDKFEDTPTKENVRDIAKIISWNIWQMDGLKCVVPSSCNLKVDVSINLFGEIEQKTTACIGCGKGDIHKHNGIYCKIKDWKTGGTLKFTTLLKR